MREHYRKDSFNVYWMGQKVHGAVAMSFKDLDHGYGKYAFSVFYDGRKIDVMAMSFTVQTGGYAKDAFNTYYLRRKTYMMAFSKRKSRRRRTSRKRSRHRRMC